MMAVQVKCTHCGKRYQVDPKMTGKKTRCKKCGQVFIIQMIEEEAFAGGDMLAGLSSAANAERSAGPAPSAAPARVDRTPPAPPQPDSFCPGCGASMPANAIVCLSCGYSKQHGGQVQTTVVHGGQAPTARGRRPRRTVEYRAPGSIRSNEGWSNPFLSFVDAAGPAILILAFAVLTIWSLIQELRNHSVTVSFGPRTVTVEQPIAAILLIKMAVLFDTLVIVVPLIMLGAWIAAKIMKFELPENPYMRSFAVLLAPLAPFMLVAVILMAFGPGQTRGETVNVPLLGALGGLAIGALCMAPFILFFATWVFYRLRALENLVAFAFVLIFLGVSLVPTGLIMAGAAKAVHDAFPVVTTKNF